MPSILTRKNTVEVPGDAAQAWGRGTWGPIRTQVRPTLRRPGVQRAGDS